MDKLYMYGSNLCKYIHCVYNVLIVHALGPFSNPIYMGLFRQKGS